MVVVVNGGKGRVVLFLVGASNVARDLCLVHTMHIDGVFCVPGLVYFRAFIFPLSWQLCWTQLLSNSLVSIPGGTESCTCRNSEEMGKEFRRLVLCRPPFVLVTVGRDRRLSAGPDWKELGTEE